MNGTTTKGLITVAIITQLGVIGSVWLTHELAAGKTQQVAEVLKTDSQKKDTKLDEIHVLVNSRLTDALNKINRLEKRLGIEPTEAPPK